jgi:hypothetical protein
MTESLLTELGHFLNARDLDSCRQTLARFQRDGGKQEEAYSALEELRGNPGISEDDVLDLMDIVSGWCKQSSRIWDSELED